jgi:hypothetical protein
MPDRLWWAYGVVADAAPLKLSLPGVEAQPVELVERDALVALASPVPAEQFSGAALDGRLEDLEALGRMAREHEAVLEDALADADVVPFRMCTLYASREAIGAMLASQRPRLLHALARVRDGIEWGVKAFAAPRLVPEVAQPATGSEYLAQRLAQRERAAASDETLERAVAEVHAQLADRASAAVLLRPQDRRLSGRDQEMLLNGAYLVPRAAALDFTRLVEALGRRHELALEITGPWPPYHFAELEA